MAREHNKLPDRAPAAKKNAPPKASKAQKNKTKKASAKKEEDELSASEAPGPAPKAPKISPAELKQQQSLLNIFSDTFADVLGLDNFTSVLQEVKSALYNRDFEKAFGNEQYLEVYAARWSPTRALCYAKVLEGIREQLEDLVVDGDRIRRLRAKGEDVDASRRPLRMLSIGGGAAEIVAFASLLRDAVGNESNKDGAEGNSEEPLQANVHLVDTGPWGSVVSKLQESLTTPPRLSIHASDAARKANRALVAPATRLSCNFKQQDALTMTAEQLSEAVRGKEENNKPGPVLVTLLFTLNELYTGGGIARTTAFLRNLTACVPEGSLLLVVDSPGSYSEAAVGKGDDAQKKKYPMQWLMDHTLLTVDKKQQPGSTSAPARRCRWEKLESHDSIWFRMVPELRYPFQLENMRYQMHLYKAIAITTTATATATPQEGNSTTATG
ncbi:25S rRNA (uridine(2843)-N(3))-methyltransferase [Apiospora marii]|uniref:25S rRNA (Uridine(2843)-N(3))-methyltransferase n=1 Tax=Apiospora marii TaxID=335849 RepID=A0ABR1SR76_9PEZI